MVEERLRRVLRKGIGTKDFEAGGQLLTIRRWITYASAGLLPKAMDESELQAVAEQAPIYYRA